MLLSNEEMKEVLKNNTLFVGQQIHINHEGCPAGVDTKRRLYIKHEISGHVFYCQHCASKGFLRADDKAIARVSELGTAYGAAPTSNRVCDDEEWASVVNTYRSSMAIKDAPIPMKLWLYSYGFDDATCNMFGIRANSQGIFLPIFSRFSEIDPIIIQHRMFTGKMKYLTYKPASAGDMYAIVPRTSIDRSQYVTDEDVIVLTEDILSAYKVACAGGYALPLMGTKIAESVSGALTAVSLAHPVHIWLDNDVAGMSGSTVVHRTLSGLGVEVVDVTGRIAQQPKEVEMEVLKNIIEKFKES